MARFRDLTMGHAVIMGRTTWEPIAERGLDGRYVVVVSRSEHIWETAGGVANSLDSALQIAEQAFAENEVFVAGGASVYREALERDLVDRMYLTLVHADLEADTYFPEFDMANWISVERATHAADESNPHGMTFCLLKRKTD